MEVERRENKLTVDQILPYVGEFGRFQKILDAMVLAMFCPVGFHPIIMYFSTLVPSWKCTTGNGTKCFFNGTFSGGDFRRCKMPREEWVYTESKHFSLVTQFDLHCSKKWMVSLVTSIFFVGWGVGAIINGWLADRFGRKKFLFPSFIVVLVTAFVTPFMPSIYIVILCRFIIGFFYPGVCVQSFILLSELVGNKQRPKATLIPYLAYPIGWMVVALKAYLLKDWKYLSIACSVPYMCIVVFYPFIPESVRWLQLHGRSEEAMETFRKIARWNRKELPSNIVLAAPEVQLSSAGFSLVDLIRTSKIALRNGIQTFIWTFIALDFYGLQLASSDLEGSVYRDFVLLCLVEIPALLLSIAFCKIFGRKKTALVPLLISGAGCLSIAFIPESGKLKIFRIILGITGKLFAGITFDTMYVWSSEMFPTGVRAAGMGILQVASRIGSASSPWVVQGLKLYGDWLPFLAMGVVSIMGSLMGMYLPETINVTMKESNVENEDVVIDLEGLKSREMKKVEKNT